MAKSGLKHIDVGAELTKTEWESEESHELLHGTSFPSSPVERQLFYRDDEHKWYIYDGTTWVWLGGGGGGGMQVHGNEYHDPDFEQQGVAATLVETHRTTETHTQPQPAAEHGNEKHNPDFATEAALSSHAAAATGVHGVGAGTIAKVGDIAVDGNLSANAQDAIAKKHTQGTDTALGALGTKNPPIDADKPIYRNSEASDSLVTSTWTQIKAFFKTYFDTIYSVLGHTHSDLSPAHKDVATGVHGVGGSTVESVSGSQAKVDAHKDLTTGAHGISSPLLIGHKLSARCKVYRSGTAQSIPEAVNTKIQYNGEGYDNYNEFDSSTNYRFTPTLPGWYLILGCYQVELNLDGAEFAHKVYKNGAESAIHINTTGMSCWGILGVFYLVYCNGTSDYLEFYAWQQKPGQGAKNLTASQTRNFVEIFLLSNM